MPDNEKSTAITAGAAYTRLLSINALLCERAAEEAPSLELSSAIKHIALAAQRLVTFDDWQDPESDPIARAIASVSGDMSREVARRIVERLSGMGLSDLSRRDEAVAAVVSELLKGWEPEFEKEGRP